MNFCTTCGYWYKAETMHRCAPLKEDLTKAELYDRMAGMSNRAYKAESELERVKKQNAAMREALEILVASEIQCEDGQPATHAWLPGATRKLILKTISSDVGKDYFSREQVMPLVEALHWIELTEAAHSDAARADCKLCKALEHARAIGLLKEKP